MTPNSITVFLKFTFSNSKLKTQRKTVFQDSRSLSHSICVSILFFSVFSPCVFCIDKLFMVFVRSSCMNIFLLALSCWSSSSASSCGRRKLLELLLALGCNWLGSEAAWAGTGGPEADAAAGRRVKRSRVWRWAWACCRWSCSSIWSCWSWLEEEPVARLTPDSWDNSSAIGSTASRPPEGECVDREELDTGGLLWRLVRCEVRPPRAWAIRLTAPCLWTPPPPPPGSSRNEIRSLAPPLCSRLRCPWKSSVTWLGSPPGYDAQMGHTTSWLASACRLDTCSCIVVSVYPILEQ